jgi:Beta-1,3-glucanase/Dockerin type I domain
MANIRLSIAPALIPRGSMMRTLCCSTLALLSIASLAAPVGAIELSFTNSSSYGDDQVYVWFGGAAEAGYDLKIAGQSQNVTLGKSYALSDLAGGLTLGRLVSGRAYISFGEPLPDPGRNGAGAPIRYPGVFSGDDGYNTRWDFIELTETPSGGDVADLTSMDNFAIPLTLQLKHDGVPLAGANASAGWKGHNDSQVVAALAALADPASSNVHRADGQFVRIQGATSLPQLYQNRPGDPRSMSAYLASIQAANRVTILDGTAFAANYRYFAALDGSGNYVLTKTGGGASTPSTIVIPASYKAGPNPADPIVTLAESLYMSNPWYSVDGGSVGPTQNDLAGAIARDLYAALNLGYVNSDHVVGAGETVNPALVGKHVAELTGSEMRELTIGFGEVNQYYNIYAAAIRDLSDSYGFAYSDWNEHLSKVAVLTHQLHDGVAPDELNVEIGGSLSPSLVEGDYNGDGRVGAGDYTVWRNTFGQTGDGLVADGNRDGRVDAADYAFWKSNFGGAVGGGSARLATVPEPACAGLFLLGKILCAIWGLRGKRV